MSAAITKRIEEEAVRHEAAVTISHGMPVDVYVPGCPPRPETVIDGIMQLQDRIARQRHPIVNDVF